LTLLFWSLAALMTGAALLAVLRPLLDSRDDSGASPDTGSRQLAACRARLLEIEQDVSNGILSAPDAELVRREIEREIVRVLETPPQHGGGYRPRQRFVAAAVALLLPVSAVMIYLQLGAPVLIRGPLTAGERHAMEFEQVQAVEEMIGQLAARLERQPDDENGWWLLARSYMAVENYAAAAGALERLLELAGDEPDVLVSLADALAMAGGGRLTGRPAGLVHQALALNANHRVGLWLAGLAASESGDRGAAVEYWNRLLPLVAADQEASRDIQQLIREAGGQPVTVPEPPVAGDAGILVRVSLAPGLESGIPGDATVFVVARSPDGSGPPVAVTRRRVADLPFEVRIDDAAAMSPAAKMSDHDRVRLSAWISPSGTAERRPGDLTSSVAEIPTRGSGPVAVTIDSRVPPEG
jgi:cytochrome c-type biogenesis protein CcmH